MANEEYCSGCECAHRANIHCPEIDADELQECEQSYRQYIAGLVDRCQVPILTPERTHAWTEWMKRHPARPQ